MCKVIKVLLLSLLCFPFLGIAEELPETLEKDGVVVRMTMCNIQGPYIHLKKYLCLYVVYKEELYIVARSDAEKGVFISYYVFKKTTEGDPEEVWRKENKEEDDEKSPEEKDNRGPFETELA